jgi:hypothetical protein
MLASSKLAFMLLLALVSDAQTDLLTRVERTELLVSGQPAQRIERDAAGNIVRLRLDGMTLSAEEFTALSRLTTLRHLSLNRTNVTAALLRKLHTLTRLEGLQLNSTELGDDATAELVKFPALRSVCLGSVPVRPEAIARLKADFESADRRLSLGYSERRR